MEDTINHAIESEDSSNRTAPVAYIKLIKNKTYYNWEIKILSLDVEELAKLNDQLIARYGGTINE